MELCEQGRFDALTGLVLRPEIIAKRFDDVISRDSDVRRSVLDHLCNRMENAGHGAERGVGFLEAPDSVEVTKKLVCAVNQVNDHEKADVRGQRSGVRSAEGAEHISPFFRARMSFW